MANSKYEMMSISYPLPFQQLDLCKVLISAASHDSFEDFLLGPVWNNIKTKAKTHFGQLYPIWHDNLVFGQNLWLRQLVTYIHSFCLLCSKLHQMSLTIFTPTFLLKFRKPQTPDLNSKSTRAEDLIVASEKLFEPNKTQTKPKSKNPKYRHSHLF